MPEVRIVGKDGLAGGCAGPRNHPVVRADSRAYSKGKTCPGIETPDQPRRDPLQRRKLLIRDRRVGCRGQRRGCFFQQRRRQLAVGNDDRHPVIAILSQNITGLIDPQGPDQVDGVQLFSHVRTEIQRHQFQPGEGIDRLPGFDLHRNALELKEGELHAKLPGLLACQPGVHSIGVRLEDAPVFRVHCFRRASKPDSADKGIHAKSLCAKELGKPAGSDPPPELHLPESVLGGDEPLGKVKILHVCRPDVRDSVAVPEDLDRRFKSPGTDYAPGPGKRASKQPKDSSSCKQNYQDDDSGGNY